MTHFLARRMTRAGLSQADLARKSGVDQGTISRVLRGADGRKATFTLEAAKKLRPHLRRLGVSLADLVLP